MTTPTQTFPTSPTGPERETLELATFDEQAFLMHNLRNLAPLHNERHKAQEHYKKLDLIKGPNTALINRLLNMDFFDKEATLNLTPAQISELVPQVRLFKQNYNPNLDVQSESEFIFPAYLNSNQILDDLGRGSYGLKSFDIETQGTTFYTADKQFTAKMVLYFQSFDQFVKSRGSYSFLDLVVQSPAFPSTPSSVSSPTPAPAQVDRSSDKSDPHSYRVRAEIGWSIGQISANSAFDKKTDSAIIKAIGKSKISFFLYPTTNDISINDDGTLTVSINYIGAFDIVARDIRAGIILTSEQKKTLDDLSNTISGAAKTGWGSTLEQSRADLQTQQTKLSKEAYESIIKELMEPAGTGTRISKVYQTALSRTAVDQFAFYGGRIDAGVSSTTSGVNAASLGQSNPQTGQTIDAPIDFCNLPWTVQDVVDGEITYPCFPPIQSTSETVTIEEIKANPIVKDIEGREYFNLQWFYLGDLLEILMMRAFNPETSDSQTLIRKFGGEFSKRVKLILSDIEVYDFCDGDIIRLNLAHVPISLRKFEIFFYNKIVTPRNLDYTIDDFIRDMLNDLMKDVFLDRSYIGNRVTKQNVNLKYMNIAAFSSSPKVDLLTPTGDTVKVDSINASKFLRSNSISSGPNNYFFYLMIYQDTYDPGKLKGDYAYDRSVGIPHIYMGRDRGITKKVSFKKNIIPYDREARIQKIGKSFDPAIQLASLYNVDLETYGNTLFLAGTYFYLIPTGMGPGLGLPNQDRSYANIMGLGGYYFVNKITWSIESGKYVTNMQSIHQATGAGKTPPNKELSPRGSGIGITDD